MFPLIRFSFALQNVASWKRVYLDYGDAIHLLEFIGAKIHYYSLLLKMKVQYDNICQYQCMHYTFFLVFLL